MRTFWWTFIFQGRHLWTHYSRAGVSLKLIDWKGSHYLEKNVGRRMNIKRLNRPQFIERASKGFKVNTYSSEIKAISFKLWLKLLKNTKKISLKKSHFISFWDEQQPLVWDPCFKVCCWSQRRKIIWKLSYSLRFISTNFGNFLKKSSANIKCIGIYFIKGCERCPFARFG